MQAKNFAMLGIALMTQLPMHAAAQDSGMQALLKRGQAIRNIAYCGDQNRLKENGPRNAEDLARVEAGVAAASKECQILLAGWNARGAGMAVDRAKARELYLAAGAFTELGNIADSDADAVEFYRKAVAAKEIKGMLALGRAYEAGRGVPRDLAQAGDSYRLAAGHWSDEGWQQLDRLQTEHKIFSEEQVKQDRARWNYLAGIRVRDVLEDFAYGADKPLQESAFELIFRRGSPHPEVRVQQSSANEVFDIRVVGLLGKLKMPPAPIYAQGDSYAWTVRVAAPK